MTEKKCTCLPDLPVTLTGPRVKGEAHAMMPRPDRNCPIHGLQALKDRVKEMTGLDVNKMFGIAPEVEE